MSATHVVSSPQSSIGLFMPSRVPQWRIFPSQPWVSRRPRIVAPLVAIVPSSKAPRRSLQPRFDLDQSRFEFLGNKFLDLCMGSLVLVVFSSWQQAPLSLLWGEFSLVDMVLK